jgi:hypothetical protein
VTIVAPVASADTRYWNIIHPLQRMSFFGVDLLIVWLIGLTGWYSKSRRLLDLYPLRYDSRVTSQ